MPDVHSTKSAKVAYQKWTETDNKVKYLMLGYMVDSIIVGYMNSLSAKVILDSLELKFGKKSSQHIEGLWEIFIRTS